MKKITPFLWFDAQAEQAMRFYVSIFKNSKVLEVTPGPDGKVMGVRFELEGRSSPDSTPVRSSSSPRPSPSM